MVDLGWTDWACEAWEGLRLRRPPLPPRLLCRLAAGPCSTPTVRMDAKSDCDFSFHLRAADYPQSPAPLLMNVYGPYKQAAVEQSSLQNSLSQAVNVWYGIIA